MKLTGAAVKFLSVERGSVPARPMIGTTFGDGGVMPDADFFVSVLRDAIAHPRAEAVPVYTFAFYHDHESGAVSVCVDTEASSARQVRATNRYNAKHFRAA